MTCFECLKNDAEKARCLGDQIRGCILMSDLFVCIDFLLMTLKNDEETVRCLDRCRDWCTDRCRYNQMQETNAQM